MNADDHGKRSAYAAHVAACRDCTRCGEGVVNPTGCPHPSPWAMELNSLHARLVVVGKDFASAERMKAVKDWCRPDLKYPINRNLPRLIEAAGLDANRDIYLTNAILCLKRARTSAALAGQWLENCSPLLRKTIDIVCPVAVAALGKEAWQAVGLAFQVQLPDWQKTIGEEPFRAAAMPLLFALAHPGHWGTQRRPLALQKDDWQRLGAHIGQFGATRAA